MEPVSSISQVAVPEFGLPVNERVPAVGAKQTSADRGDEGGTQQPAVESVVKDLNDAVKMFNTNLSFSIDKDTGKTVIKVVDVATKEVIRQIPPDDVLRIAAHIKELLGILYDKKR